MQPAGFFIRIIATVLDCILIAMVSWLSVLIFCGTLLLPQVIVKVVQNGWLVAGITLSYIVFSWILWSATPGKLALGMRIVDADTGKRPTPRQAFLRIGGYICSLLPLNLGFLWILVDEEKRGWHDKIGGTAVVVLGEDRISQGVATSRL